MNKHIYLTLPGIPTMTLPIWSVILWRLVTELISSDLSYETNWIKQLNKIGSNNSTKLDQTIQQTGHYLLGLLKGNLLLDGYTCTSGSLHSDRSQVAAFNRSESVFCNNNNQQWIAEQPNENEHSPTWYNFPSGEKMVMWRSYSDCDPRDIFRRWYYWKVYYWDKRWFKYFF